jgi:hypothetical protein
LETEVAIDRTINACSETAVATIYSLTITAEMAKRFYENAEEGTPRADGCSRVMRDMAARSLQNKIDNNIGRMRLSFSYVWLQKI